MRHNVAELEAQMRATRAQLEAANAKLEARAGRNLVFAIGIGVALGGAFLVSLIILKWLFILFGAVLIGFAVFELSSALRFAGRDVPRVASVVVAVVAMPAAFFLGVEGLWLAVIAGVVVITLWRLGELVTRRGRASARDVLKDLVAGGFVQLYVTLLGGFYVVLTGLDGGQWWTLAAIITVVAVDLGAYAAGVTLGRHPMAPRISPKKTWEGFAGAAVFAVVSAVLLSWLMLQQSPWLGIPLGLALLITATGGDLVESLIKRDLGIKDISSWLPGHGGFLDRLDSILSSAAVAYAFYLVVVR
ncbi:MAG: phosphatidate cytidylyltransferase [Micrococcales bacterium]|nr:phosphatidate cytidylyltransferase [Micrococcales bacterium]